MNPVLKAQVRVIGCGNPDAGDDAAGLLTVRRARPELERLPGVTVSEARAALTVLDLLDGSEAVVIVDAVRSTGGARKPGELVRFESGPAALPAEARSALSSHGLGLAEALGLAAVLGRAPRLILLGVEVGDVSAGHPLSPEVARSLPDLASHLHREVIALLAEAPG